MKIATQTDTLAKNFGEHEAIKILAKLGYDALDYSMFSLGNQNHPLSKSDYKEYALSLKKTAEEFNIEFNQSHAPFPSYKEENEKYNEEMIDLIIKALEITSIIGGKIVIVHPISLQDKVKQKEKNIEFYNRFLPYCQKFNVKIALENMWGWDMENKCIIPAACSTTEEFIDYLDSLDKNYFVACLDVGHADMQGAGATAVSMIKSLGHDRLKALHIHDNDTVSDLHMLPFTHKLKWQEIAIALKQINYDGEFTFESDNFINKFPKELMINASAFMIEVGRYFVKNYNL